MATRSTDVPSRVRLLWLGFLLCTACATKKPSSRPDSATTRSALPQHDTESMAGRDSSKHPVIRGLLVGSLRVELDSTSAFAQIMDSLGPAPITKPQKHDDTWKLCYELTHSKDARYVVFESPDIEDPNHFIVAVHILQARPASAGLACVPASTEVDSVATENGLRIGMTRDSVASLMGAPNRKADGEDIYEHDELVDTSPHDSTHLVTGYEIYSSCSLRFLNGKAASIRLFYAKTS